MTAADLLILTLACWRVAYFVTHDDAPFGVMRRIRERVGGGLTCIVCTSVWASALVYVLWLTVLQPVVIVAAVSGGALMMHRWVGWNFVQEHPDS